MDSLETDYLISDEYIKAFESKNFNNLSNLLKTNIEDHINRITNSKSAWKKEAKRIKIFQQKKLKEISNESVDITSLTGKEYLEYRLNNIRSNGYEPYPHFFETNYDLTKFVYDFGYLNSNESLESKELRLTGRIMLKRSSSKKLYFYTLEYNECDLQVLASQNLYSDNNFLKINSVLSRGDYIGVIGYPHRSKRGELSIIPYKLILLAPCLNLLPKNVKDIEGKDIGVYTNKELRFRNRHLDWMLNSDNRKIIKTRSKIIRYIRNYFDDRDFYEVETPTLNLVSAGANARPFTTYINAFNMPVFLRIAPELKLKQMIIGGFTRVYEIGKQFRNEDVDRTHLPEFTSIEFYEQGADYYSLMKTTEELLSEIVMKLKGDYKVKYNLEPDNYGIEKEISIDFTPPFKKLDMKSALYERIKKTISDFEYPSDMFSEEGRLYLIEIVSKLGIECSPPQTTARLIDKLVGEFIEPECINPTFITNHFQVMSPLAKYHRDNKELTERFELFVTGKELCNAFTELNDPVLQEKLFMAQVEDKKLGDDEAQMKDDEFVEALKYGLPPTGGWGMGIDRLVMFLSNQNTIREVVSYPTMKPL